MSRRNSKFGNRPAPDLGTYKRHPTGQVDPVGPSLAELQKRSQQKNFEKRFTSPLAFHEPKFKKVKFWTRYPKAFVIGTTVTWLLCYFGKPAYDIWTKVPTPYELERQRFLEYHMEKTGFSTNPFNLKKRERGQQDKSEE